MEYLLHSKKLTDQANRLVDQAIFITGLKEKDTLRRLASESLAGFKMVEDNLTVQREILVKRWDELYTGKNDELGKLRASNPVQYAQLFRAKFLKEPTFGKGK